MLGAIVATSTSALADGIVLRDGMKLAYGDGYGKTDHFQVLEAYDHAEMLAEKSGRRIVYHGTQDLGSLLGGVSGDYTLDEKASNQIIVTKSGSEKTKLVM